MRSNVSRGFLKEALEKNTYKERLLKSYELMVTSRYIDEKMAKMVKQNKGGTFQLSAAGHELVGVVAAQALIAGKDWGFAYYRDQPFALGIGCDIKELFGAFLGRATRNHSSGRMMPYHYSHKELRLFCQSSVVGSQFLHAVGRAWAIKNLGKDEVVYVSGGDGATSQGDFHEAMNFASIHKLGIIFVIQSNGWAISVPAHEQTSGGSVAHFVQGYKDIVLHEVEGNHYTQMQLAMEEAVERARKGYGASCIVAHVPRLAAHSNSDDPKKYRSEKDCDREALRDPLPIFAHWLQQEGFFNQDEIAEIHERIKEKVEEAAAGAEKIPLPEKGSASLHVFAPFDPPQTLEEIKGEGEKIVMIDAINHALCEEMEFNPYVVIFGQDVAHGKGGVFGATRGLTEKFGTNRCFNTPLAESTIIGIAVGIAADGLHLPVAEIQFADYLWTGINQLFNEVASIHYRSNGEWQVPIVIRMPCGGYIQGGPYHSQSIEGFLAHCPGLKVVIPSNSADAKMLLKTAIRDPNPVVFLEHKGLYRQQKFSAQEEPGKTALLPFGQARVVHEGKELTVVAWGMMVLMALEIAEKLACEGVSVEVVDIRTIVPLDMATILTSVKKTGKVIVAHEAPQNCGFGAEVVARIAKEGFVFLDAPIERVAGLDAPVPYSKPLENEVLPQLADLELSIRKLLKY